MTEALIGRGIYDPSEVARLARVHPETLARWTKSKKPLVAPSFDRFFDFEDLVRLLIVAELHRRNVPTVEIRTGIEKLGKELGVDRPLAHIEARDRIATVGRSFFANLGEWYDVGKGLQGVFEPVIAPVLRPIEYATSGMANLWRPLERVTATPVVQAGTPCVEKTRVPTSTLAGLAKVGEDLEDIAYDLDLLVEEVEAALKFEAALDAPLLAGRVLAG